MILYLLLNLNFAFAADKNCNSMKDYKDFYYCSLQKHPEFEISKLKAEEASAALDKAAQWENPELELKSISGKNAGENVGGTEISVSIPISQLWTRSGKKSIGLAEKKIVEIESQETLLSVRKSLVKDLYRIRQVEDELNIVKESLDAFDRIKNQLKGRLARGPEQEITLNLVELASSDYELKKNHLNIERAEIASRMKALWDTNFEIKKEFLPPIKTKWPVISKDANIGQSFEVRKIAAQAEKADAEHDVAIHESLPSVSAGPTFERTTEGTNQYTSYGANLTLSLPLFSLNGGGRRLAETRSRQAALQSNYAVKKAVLEKDIFFQKYQSAVDSLMKSSNRNEVKKKHDRIDSLFRQGLASGSIVIEAHRQITEYTESQHEHEISALDAFLEIKTLSGENIEEILQ